MKFDCLKNEYLSYKYEDWPKKIYDLLYIIIEVDLPCMVRWSFSKAYSMGTHQHTEKIEDTAGIVVGILDKYIF